MHVRKRTNQYTQRAERYYVSDWIRQRGTIDRTHMLLLYQEIDFEWGSGKGQLSISGM